MKIFIRMKLISSVTLLFLVLGHQAISQKTIGTKAGSARVTPIEGHFHGFRTIQSDDLELEPTLVNLPSENESADKNKLDKIKKEKLKQKMAFLSNYKEGDFQELEKKTRGLNPVVVSSYVGVANAGTPSDNSCAVNNSNVLVAMVNSNMRTYNTTTGAGLSSTVNIDNFFNSLPNSNNTCDPKVIYDQEANRFIAFAQTCDAQSATSDLLLAFSKTADPAAGWYFYTFSGNPSTITQDVWFDYPKIGVSNKDLFISGNFFDDAFSYVESGIYQIDKIKCYSGAPLVNGDALFWSSLDGNPFTMVPMSNGQAGGYGNNMYLVSTAPSFGGNQLNVYEITNSVHNSPQMTMDVIGLPDVSDPGDGVQKGTSILLKTGDARAMDGFYLNGIIHYVCHMDVGSGYCGFKYVRLAKNGTWGISKQANVKITGKDIAFPSVASFGFNQNDQGAILTFDYCSSTEYPGMKAVYFDHNFTQSGFVEVKTGTGPVTYLAQNGVTRWGDYSGIGRVHNASKPTVWCFGMTGNTSNNWTNYFAQLTTSDFPLENQEVKVETTQTQVYPNPITTEKCSITVDFPEAGNIVINLLDLNGRIVRNVFNGNSGKGEKVFSFNKGALAEGNYVLSIALNNKIIHHEKISVTR